MSYCPRTYIAQPSDIIIYAQMLVSVVSEAQKVGYTNSNQAMCTVSAELRHRSHRASRF